MYRNIYISILTRIHAQTHSVCKHRGEQRKTPWLFELFRGLLCPAIWGLYGILISDYKGPYQSTSRTQFFSSTAQRRVYEIPSFRRVLSE